MKLFKDILSELTENSGKTQNKICKDIGVYKQKYSRWKMGITEPNIDEIKLLAKYFNVTTDYLLGIED